MALCTLIISYRPVSDYSHLAGSWRLGPQHINLGDTASGKTPSPLATCQRMGAGVVSFWLCGQRCRERLCAHFCGRELALLSLQTWIETWGCLEDSRSGHTSRAQDSVGHVVTSELWGGDKAVHLRCRPRLTEPPAAASGQRLLRVSASAFAFVFHLLTVYTPQGNPACFLAAEFSLSVLMSGSGFTVLLLCGLSCLLRSVLFLLFRNGGFSHHPIHPLPSPVGLETTCCCSCVR